MKKILFVIMMVASTVAMAQTGYVNSQALIGDMPEVAKADESLKQLATRLQADVAKREENAKQKMEELAYEMQAPKVTPERQQEIRLLAQEIEKEVTNANKLSELELASKRNELLEPVYKKVNDAIAAIAKKRGMKVVVDISAILYADEDLDLTADVRKELGL
ncbi:MAG: OmpH family outer membrane protein [Nonlabens sp.]|nr:OmpH family outer membrane protein [Nonlabens sp.]